MAWRWQKGKLSSEMKLAETGANAQLSRVLLSPVDAELGLVLGASNIHAFRITADAGITPVESSFTQLTADRAEVATGDDDDDAGAGAGMAIVMMMKMMNDDF